MFNAFKWRNCIYLSVYIRTRMDIEQRGFPIRWHHVQYILYMYSNEIWINIRRCGQYIQYTETGSTAHFVSLCLLIYCAVVDGLFHPLPQLPGYTLNLLILILISPKDSLTDIKCQSWPEITSSTFISINVSKKRIFRNYNPFSLRVWSSSFILLFRVTNHMTSS